LTGQSECDSSGHEGACLCNGSGSSSSGGVSGSSSGGVSSSSGSSSSSSSSGAGADAGVLPTLAINLPDEGGLPTLTAMANSSNQSVVNIPFTTTNFTIMAPGACTNNSTDNSCGHVHIYVDGSACTPDGSPYNNGDTTASPAVAILSNCPTIDGSHTVSLELHHGDHSPIVNPATMMTVSASAPFSAMGP
jgi:hypothetical protein